jgi:hypothetical protein
MANRTNLVTYQRTIGDVAVDGLLAGMAAGLGMAAFLLLTGLLNGVSPVATLGRFDPAEGGSAVVGGLLHLTVSGIYGVVFALIWRVLSLQWPALQRYGRVIGGLYGVGLWLAALWIIMPLVNASLLSIPAVTLAASHAIYGIILGYGIAKT